MYTIDPTFSVYRLIERIQDQRVLLNHRRTMSLISYEIENAALLDGTRTRVFAGFQYMSKFLPQVKRYQKLAATAEVVYVFGVPDIQPPAIANIYYIPLSPTDQMAREWFLVASSADYSGALATEEISRFTDPDDQRQFKGIWTYDVNIVEIMHDWLTSLVDARPRLDDGFNHQRHHELVGKSLRRLNETLVTLAPTSTTQRELTEALTATTSAPEMKGLGVSGRE